MENIDSCACYMNLDGNFYYCSEHQFEFYKNDKDENDLDDECGCYENNGKIYMCTTHDMASNYSADRDHYYDD